MSKTSLTHWAIASALVLCSAALCVRAQTPVKTQKRGVVAGKVTIKGKPAPGIFVSLRLSDPGTPFESSFKATTDQEGNYRITNVPAGTYMVAPKAAAFVVSASNNSRNETVVLSEGETVEGIDFALVRGGVITGKVTDAEGRPVVAQRVSLAMPDLRSNQRGPIYPLGMETDDRGIYRMFGIPPGRYNVAAGQDNDNFYMSARGRASYKQIFYPNVSDPSKATVIEVSEGSETSNIDISLERAAQTFWASGRVVDGENGQPIGGARFSLQLINQGRTSSISSLTLSNSQGEFRLENLLPGKYAVFLIPEQGSELRSDAVSFEVIDQSVSGLVMKTLKGASLTGSIVLENTEDKAVFAKLMQLTIHGFVQRSVEGMNMGHSSTINSDASFTLNGLEPGPLYISLGARDRTLMKGFTVARIERDGVVEGRSIEVKNGDRITGVRVIVSYGSSTVRGVVRLDNGMLPEGAHILVRVTKAGESRPNIQSPQVDSRGHFIIEGIPGGLYDFETEVFLPGASRRTQPRAKQQVSVADGAVTDVTITVVVDPNPGAITP